MKGSQGSWFSVLGTSGRGLQAAILLAGIFSVVDHSSADEKKENPPPTTATSQPSDQGERPKPLPTAMPSQPSLDDVVKLHQATSSLTGSRPNFENGIESEQRGGKLVIRPLTEPEAAQAAHFMVLDSETIYAHMAAFPQLYARNPLFVAATNATTGKNTYVEALREVDFSALIQRGWIQEKYPDCFSGRTPEQCLLMRTMEVPVGGKNVKIPYSDGIELDSITPESFSRLAMDISIRADALVRRQSYAVLWKTEEYRKAKVEALMKGVQETDTEMRKAFVVVSVNDGSLDSSDQVKIEKFIAGEIPLKDMPYDPKRRVWVEDKVHLRHVLDEKGNWLSHIKDYIHEQHRILKLALDSKWIEVPRSKPKYELGDLPNNTEAPGIRPIFKLRESEGGWWVQYNLPKGMAEDFFRRIVMKDKKLKELTTVSVMTIRITEEFVNNTIEAARVDANWQWNEDETIRNPNLLRRSVLQHGADVMVALANANVPEGLTYPQFVVPAPQTPVVRDPVLAGGNLGVGAAERFFVESSDTYGINLSSPFGKLSITWREAALLSEVWRRTFASSRVKNIDLTGDRQPVPFLRDRLGEIKAVAQQIDSDETLQQTINNGTQTVVGAKAFRALVIENAEITPLPGTPGFSVTEFEEAFIKLWEINDILVKDPLVPQKYRDRLAEFFPKPGRSKSSENALETFAQAINSPSEGSTLEEYSKLIQEIWDELKDKPRTDRDSFRYQDLYDRRIEAKKDLIAGAKRKIGTVSSLAIIVATGQAINGVQSVQSHFRGTVNLLPGVITEIETREELNASEDKQTNTRHDEVVGLQQKNRRTRERTFLKIGIDDSIYGIYKPEFPNNFSVWNLPWGRESNNGFDQALVSLEDHPAKILARQRFGGVQGFECIDPQLANSKTPVNGKTYSVCDRRFYMLHLLLSGLPIPTDLYSFARNQWITSVESRITFDEDFFNQPNVALMTDSHWADSGRVLTALLNTSKVKDPEHQENGLVPFGILNMRRIVDEVGAVLLPDETVRDLIATGSKKDQLAKGLDWFGVGEEIRNKHFTLRARPLTEDERRDLRRDLALHWLVAREIIPITVMEAMSRYWGLGSYTHVGDNPALFENYRTLIAVNPVYCRAQPDRYQEARVQLESCRRAFTNKNSHESQKVRFPYLLVGEQLLKVQ